MKFFSSKYVILEFSNRVALVLRLEGKEGTVEQYHSLGSILVSTVFGGLANMERRLTFITWKPQNGP